MNEPAEYGLLYNEEIREVVEPISEAEAQKRWENRGDPFEVILGDPAKPRVSIQANCEDQVYVVNFFDDLARRALTYTFVPSTGRPEQLFLAEITTWEWDSPDKHGPDEATEIHSYEYREDGYVKHTIDREDADHYDVEELQDVPLDINWEPVPRFGDWASIARYKRSASVDDPENALA